MSDGNAQEEGETLVFTCAGAAYSGQVANRSGVDLMKQGAGQLFCAAAVAANRSEKVERTRRAGKRVVIDGCDDDCARRILESANLVVDVHVEVTKLGVEKIPDEPRMLTDTKRVVDAIKARLSV